MRTIAIENSTALGSTAVAVDHALAAEDRFSGAAELAQLVQRLLARFGNPDEVVVGIGPGSYTGLRVAIALAAGLEIGLGCSCFGCPSVLGFAPADYTVVGDARMNSAFLAVVAQRRLQEELRLVSQTDLPSWVRGKNPLFLTSALPGIEGVVQVPEAKYLLAARDSYTALEEPIYLKPPYTTTPKR